MSLITRDRSLKFDAFRHVQCPKSSSATYRFLRFLAFLTNRRKSERSPGRADQLYDGVCSIEQRQHGRHHDQEKSRGLGREVLMRFATEVIPANSMEGRFAGACASTTSIDACCAGIEVRLRGHTPFAPDYKNGSRSMTNFYESVGSAAASVVPCSTSPSAAPSAYSATLASALR